MPVCNSLIKRDLELSSSSHLLPLFGLAWGGAEEGEIWALKKYILQNEKGNLAATYLAKFGVQLQIWPAVFYCIDL